MNKKYYYLIAQLPDISASGEKAVPITEKQYRELCSRFLSAREMKVMNTLSLVPPKEQTDTGS
ncbi:MAG TPA: hypothetical protein DCL73_06260, partial [Treponema sp.]|nr:hypothetical protein [Treponema sp.]